MGHEPRAVGGEGGSKLFTDGVAGQRDLPVLTREWYCPREGLERDEPAGACSGAGWCLRI